MARPPRNAPACASEAAAPEPVQHHVHHRRAPRKRLHRPALQGRRASPQVGAPLRSRPPGAGRLQRRQRGARSADKEAEAQSSNTALAGPPQLLSKDRPAALPCAPQQSGSFVPWLRAQLFLLQSERPCAWPRPPVPLPHRLEATSVPSKHSHGRGTPGCQVFPVGRCLALRPPSLRSRGGSGRAASTG